MTEVQLRHLVRGLFILTLACITWLALDPAPPEAASLGWDKANHLVAFLVLTLLAHYGFPGYFGFMALGLAAWGLGIELIQAMLPAREFEWADLAADLAGIGLCALFRRQLPGLKQLCIHKDINP